MSDVEIIQRHKALYLYLVDATAREKDEAMLDELEALFTEDAVGDYSWDTFNGGRMIRDYFGRSERHAKNIWTWHTIHSPLIEVDGDRARARWTVYAKSARAESPSEIMTTFGRYDDLFVKSAHGWKISRLKFINETSGGAR